MSGNNENKGQAATDKIKAAALSATKGLSRAQAERAAAAAARNVNAYGQKEEGPSRWQEKREAKRQMYLMSTEKQVRLGERKDLNKPAVLNVNSSAQCQKCYQTGHWTYECKNERVYIARPSRTQQLNNPKLRMKLSVEYDLDNGASSRVDEEVKIGKGKNQVKKKNKRKYRSNSDSGSDSEASVFETDSGSSSVTLTGSESDSEESSYCSSSDSEEERRRRRRKKKKQQERRKERRKRYSSSSSGSESDSVPGSESDSDDDRSSRRKRRHSRRR